MSQETLARVKAMCQSLMQEYRLGGRALPQTDGDRITPDSLFIWLMDMKDDHRRRARKARMSGKARRIAPTENPADPPADVPK